jgi:hypothetical protein
MVNKVIVGISFVHKLVRVNRKRVVCTWNPFVADHYFDDVFGWNAKTHEFPPIVIGMIFWLLLPNGQRW